MKNVAHLNTSFYLSLETEMDQEQFENKFSKENIVNSKIEMTLPDGSVHIVSFADVVGMDLVEFETHIEDKEEATKQ